MPPPGTYIEITNPPLFLPGPGFTRTVTVAEFNTGTFSGGVNNEVWFRYDTGSDPEAFGWFIGTSTGFSPATNLYQSDGSTLVEGNTGPNAMWWPLANNSTYYVRIRNNPTGAITNNFNCLFEGTYIGLTTVPDGSWVVNDDSDMPGGNDGFPSAVYDPSGEFIGFIQGIPAGEIGDALPNGVSLWHDRFGMYGGQLALFDASFGFLDDFTPSPALINFPRICNDGTDFYVIDYQTADIFRVDPVAVTISAAIGTIPWVDDISGVGVSRDGTTMYWAEGVSNGVIRSTVIGSGVAVELYSIPGFAANDYVALTALNNHPGEVLVLQDGTIATYWYDDSEEIYHLIHLSAAGSLMHDVQFPQADGYRLDHIHYSPSGAGGVHVWFFANSSASIGKFGEVTWSTGTFSLLFETDLTSAGGNLVSGSDTIFGPSASCSMVTYVYPSTPEPPSPYLGFETTLPRRWVRVTPTVTQENNRIFIPMIELDCQVGVGNASGQIQDTDPVVMVEQSTDGGYTWGNQRTITMGEIGEYGTLLRLYRWDAGRRQTFRFSGSAAVPVVLTDLYITAEPGTH